MKKDWKDNVHFVLVGPKEQGNIGASARAIKNMGFSRLSLVGPPDRLGDEARWFAHNAEDVLESADIFGCLSEAIGDKSLVVGTTRRTGKRRGVIVPIGQGASKIYELARNNKVAVLFGRESRGLFNEEVEECGFLMTIPSSSRQPSLNLAQAVLITAYELSKAEYGRSESAGQPMKKTVLVDHGELEALYKRIGDVLRLLDYIPQGDRHLAEKIMLNLKHFIGRAGLTDWELKMLHGIISRIEKRVCGESRGL